MVVFVHCFAAPHTADSLRIFFNAIGYLNGE